MFKLDSGAIEFSVSDLDQEKSGMRFAYNHTGLDADWNIFSSDEDSEDEFTFEMEEEPETGETPEASESTPAEPLDAETERLIDELAPRELAIDVRLTDVPSKQLWNTFVSTIYSGASEGAMDSQMEMMGMMLPMMLAQAGSTVRIVDTRIVAQAARLSVDGEVKADPASMMGASGSLTVEITGLDRVIDLVKGYVGPEAAADTAPLEMLRAFGERTQAEGETVDRYVVTLEPNGALMVNGKDMNFLPVAARCRSSDPGRGAASAEFDPVVDLVTQSDPVDRQHHLGVQGAASGQPAGRGGLAHRELDRPLRGHADLLEKLSDRHVERVLVHRGLTGLTG
jgi:hypothetical protein